MIVYVSIGNSDDKLTQADWSRFVVDMDGYVASYADTVHGRWFSAPEARWQNACWCLEFINESDMLATKQAAAEIRKAYRQDSAAWAVAETEFI